MKGVQLLKGRGMVDEARIAVSGWSDGGFMTAWLTAHYDGWAAAVAEAPVTDWFDKLYHALKDNEVEVRFIAYPVAGDFPSDPVH
jgi:prolyl oligopeptidase PreP (S9A serine peptidase family)